ncbi:amidohydrolase [Pontibacter sp. SGAir0037]|uniref:amidohydrolase family protein n=1 Tax=Pontibacter sp. SGAir0037 TaxID=2571030 RepID=UPI0010CD55C4|nr:amidohydrolase family protein [Pontibacter sp. SGAir0037]QCR22219.1 amidohydrolase [Pontibacter sp. SGAir0037]
MLRIDAHQHFWKYDPVREEWLTDEMAAIRRDFMPQDLQPVLAKYQFDGCVLVQNGEPELENDFLLECAAAHDFIKGVVGWVDLLAPDINEKLAKYRIYPKLKGFRYILQSSYDRALMLKPDFMRGISALGENGYTYDILIYPDQLKHTKYFVATFPDQAFVVDHLAKPNIREQKLYDWKRDMLTLGHFENVFCKLSGMVTEADLKNWRKEDFRPYLDTVVEAFGTKRIMFGSDWPVCLAAGSYDEILGIVQDYFAEFSQSEQADFFGGNAAAFYKLR